MGNGLATKSQGLDFWGDVQYQGAGVRNGWKDVRYFQDAGSYDYAPYWELAKDQTFRNTDSWQSLFIIANLIK